MSALEKSDEWQKTLHIFEKLPGLLTVWLTGMGSGWDCQTVLRSTGSNLVIFSTVYARVIGNNSFVRRSDSPTYSGMVYMIYLNMLRVLKCKVNGNCKGKPWFVRVKHKPQRTVATSFAAKGTCPEETINNIWWFPTDQHILIYFTGGWTFEACWKH